MALKQNLIQQAVAKVQQFASNIGKNVQNSIQDNQQQQAKSPLSNFGPFVTPNFKNPQIKSLYSSVNTPEKQVQFNQTPVTNAIQGINSYVMNRYIAPISQVPMRAKQLFGKESTGKERLQGGLGVLGGTVAMVPDPVGDVLLPAYDYWKGQSSATKSGAGFLDAQKSGIKGLIGQETTGLGTAVAKGTRGENLLNLAELPLIIGATGKYNKTKQLKELTLKSESEIMSALNSVRNYKKFSPEAQMNIITDITKTAKKIAPDIINNKEMKAIYLKSPETWMKYVTDRMVERLADAKNPKLDIGFSIKRTGDGSMPKTKVTPQTGIVPQMEPVQIGQSKVKASKQPIKVQQNPLSPETVVPTTPKSSQLSISKKGKLNTDKLDITPEQKASIDQLQDNVPVTVIGNKDVVNQSKYTTGRKSVLTDEEMKIRLAQQLNTRQEVVSLSRQYEKLQKSGASELELTALKSKIIDQSRIAQQQGTFAGRLLQAQNILANDLASPEQKIYALLDNAGIDSKTYIKDAINVDFNDANQVVNFYRKYVPAKFGEILDEIRYINMLSSPLTHIINTTSNILQSTIVKPIEKTITGGLDFISSKLTGKERQYFTSQGVDYSKGVVSALPEAWKRFKTIASGKEISLRPDMEFIPTATKGPLKWYTTPLRILEASDQFFRTLVTSGERRSLARFKIPEAELIKRAQQSADYTLFRQKFDPSGELGQGIVLKTWDKWNSAIQQLRKVPGGKWVIPFLQTPTNILKQGLEYSPLGVSTMIGAKRPLEQLSKAIIGTTVFTTLYSIADKGGTTWDLPTNAKEKELFYAAGLQPYSIKIGDKWVSYSKLGPLAYPMAMASALKWVEKNNPDQNVVENLRDALGQMLGFFGDQSYVQSVGDLVSTIQSSTPNKLASGVNSQITNFAGQLVPYRAFQGWLARLIDPTYRKPEGMVQSITSQIPGLSQNVAPYTDPLGNPSKRDLPVLNAFSPFKVGVEKEPFKSQLDTQEQNRITRAVAKRSIEKGGNGMSEGGELIVYQNENGNQAEINLANMDKIANMPTSNKYETALRESKQFSQAGTILDNDYLTQEQKQLALTRLGIEPTKAAYYAIANDNTNLKTMYVMDALQGSDNPLDVLAKQREQVNGQMIASNAVLDNLVDEGLITKAQATQLKKYKYENGKLTPIKKSTGTGTKKAKKITIKAPSLKKIKIKKTKVKKIKTKAFKPIKFKIPKKLKIKKIAIKKLK